MKNYHILYKDNESDTYAKGYNITAESPIVALARFINEKPEAHFIYLAIVDIK